MSDRYMEDSMEDLAYDEAEGAGDGYDEGDEADVDAGEEGDEFLRSVLGGVARIAGGLMGGGGGGGEGADEDGWDEDGADEDGYDEDGADEWDEDGADELDDMESAEGEHDSLEDAMADALEAEDTDEFFRRIARVARTVGRTAGRVARVVAPIASAIPIPQAQAIGRIANVVGRVLADGADESDALEELFDYAEAEDAVDAAAPVIAAMTLRQRMPGVGRAPRAVRRQLVQNVAQATRTLARTQGPAAARAVPGVVQTVQRGVRRRVVPPRRVGPAVQRVARRVAGNPRAVRALANRARATAPHGNRRHGRRHPQHNQRRRHHRGRGHRRAPHGGMRPGGVGAPIRTGSGAVARPGAAGCNCASCRRTRHLTLRGPVRITIHGR